MTTKMDVANYLARHVALSGKTNKEIAAECGIDSVNMVSMLKSGGTKVPLTRIPALSEALGCEAQELLRMCLEAYSPELLGLICESHPAALVTAGEVDLLRRIREYRAVAASLGSVSGS